MTRAYVVGKYDPITSFIAAEAIDAFSGSHCERILAALAQGPGTACELMDRTGLTVVQIDRRLPELLRNEKARVVQFDGNVLIRDGYRVWTLT